MTRAFIQPARSIIDYALVRKTIGVNQSIIWELDRENITILPIFYAFKSSEQQHPI